MTKSNIQLRSDRIAVAGVGAWALEPGLIFCLGFRRLTPFRWLGY
jgi:hypothetical protein